MNWAILLGSAAISGGTNVIFEHASRAQRRGVNVSIITEAPVRPADHAWHPAGRSLRWLTYSQLAGQEFDVALATWWVTAYHLYRVPARRYGYFVQSIESRFYPETDRRTRGLVDATYALPTGFITEATWIRDYLGRHYGVAAELVHNGIRKDLFAPHGSSAAPRVAGRLRVLVEGSVNVPFKNVPRTIELCRQSRADEVWLLSPTPIESCPGVDRLFSCVPIHETPAIYRSCDVLVKLSYVEGMFGPPLEMFHCGGTSVVYAVTGHDEYIRDRENAVVCRPDDELAVVQALDRLKADPDLLARLKRGAAATAAGWPDWDSAAQRFEAAVTRLIEKDGCTRDQLVAHLPRVLDWLLFRQNQQEVALSSQARLLEERWSAMQEMERMIQERDATVAAQARLLDERWAAMQAMERLIRDHSRAPESPRGSRPG
jgi:glycosyltransferase involved in cell wall biosynthesis